MAAKERKELNSSRKREKGLEKEDDDEDDEDEDRPQYPGNIMFFCSKGSYVVCICPVPNT